MIYCGLTSSDISVSSLTAGVLALILNAAAYLSESLPGAIQGSKLKRRVTQESLLVHLQDNRSAWDMDSDGSYRKSNPGDATPLVS